MIDSLSTGPRRYKRKRNKRDAELRCCCCLLRLAHQLGNPLIIGSAGRLVGVRDSFLCVFSYFFCFHLSFYSYCTNPSSSMPLSPSSSSQSRCQFLQPAPVASLLLLYTPLSWCITVGGLGVKTIAPLALALKSIQPK